MDESLLRDIFPSLLIFSSVAFSLIFVLPTLRYGIKGEFRRKMEEFVSSGNLMPTGQFFWGRYYITVTKHLDSVGIAYLSATLLVLLSPWCDRLYDYAWGVVVFATSAFLGIIVDRLIGSCVEAVRKGRVSF